MPGAAWFSDFSSSSLSDLNVNFYSRVQEYRLKYGHLEVEL